MLFLNYLNFPNLKKILFQYNLIWPNRQSLHIICKVKNNVFIVKTLKCSNWKDAEVKFFLLSRKSFENFSRFILKYIKEYSFAF